MFSGRRFLGVGACALMLQGALGLPDAVASEAAQALVKQAEYWYSKGNIERSREAWARLLQLEPSNSQALYWQGVLALRDNNLNGAADYLKQLKQVPDGAERALLLDQDIYLQQAGRPEQLEQARVLAESGELNSAVAAYRKLLAGRSVQGDLAFEFYNYLGYTDAGWSEAKEGFGRLVKQYPKRGDIAIAQAKLLTRDQTTRVQGLRQLEALADDREVGAEALETWREVLTWMGPPRSDALPLFKSYLKRFPDDQAIRKQMQLAQQATATARKPVETPTTAAFKALERGDIGRAEALFEQRLSRYPKDPDALAGVALVRQKQGRLSDAEVLLNQAVRQSNGQKWRKNLDDVRYWSMLEQANEQLAKGRPEHAQQSIQQALTIKPKGLEAGVAKADLAAAQGQYTEAEAGYRAALKQAPNNLQAKRGLIAVLSQQGRPDEAQRLLESLPLTAREQLGGLHSVRAEQAWQRARIAAQRGDPQGQRQALEEAVKSDPQHVWARHDLARLYIGLGAKDEARSLMAGLLQSQPNDPDSLYACALIAVQLGEWKRAQEYLARLPLEGRDVRVNQLVSEVDFQQRMAEISALNKAGRYQEARVMLARVTPLAAASSQRQAMLASAYADAKDPQKALSLLKQQLSRSPQFEAGLTLSYAGVLLQTGHDIEVAGILRDLQNRSLSLDERAQYDDLLFLYRVRQAEQLLEQGQLADAYETLSPALLQRPQDPTAQAVLARMYARHGDKKKALELYTPIAQAHPDNALLLLGAADVATQQGHNGQAKEWLEQAVKTAPQDPDVLTGAARIYRQQGYTARASKLMEQVVAQERRQQQPLYATSGPSAAPANPFASPEQVLPATPSQVIPEPAVNYSAASTPAHKPLGGGINTFAATAVTEANPFKTTDSRGHVDPQAGMSPAARLLDDLEQERSAYVVQGLTLRNNDSEKGLSKLTDVQAPLEINFPLGENRLAVQITPTHLSAGSVGSDAKQRFGAGALSATGELSSYLASNPSATQQELYAVTNQLLSPSAGSQHDSGVGLAVAWEHQPSGIKADLGVSPLGFLYSTAVGGVSIERAVAGSPHVNYSVGLSRRSVTDSLTSFAGAKDARVDAKWGGVTANGVRAQLGYDDGSVGAYGLAALQGLNGHNVKDNTRAELGAGIYWYLLNQPDHLLTAGLSLTAIGYDNNQSSFNYGSGGYFSPQKFFSLAVPVQWAQRTDRWTYKVNGALGVQHFSQDSTPYFINDSDAQRALEQLSAQAAASGLNLPTRYDGSSKTSLGYSLAAAAEYQLGSNFFFGGHLGVDNAQDYQQWNAGLYLRYMVKDMTGPLALPVIPYQSPYAN